ncbi:unnamed protein product [Closterium sp. Naga37s-1]|nr:unnamed protein product [Closterium sp. Naga37s-1]
MGAAREEACAGHFILLSSVPYPHSLPRYSPPLQTDKATLLGEIVDVLRALHAERHAEGEATEGERRGTDKATLLGEVVDVLRALHAERHAEGEGEAEGEAGAGGGMGGKGFGVVPRDVDVLEVEEVVGTVGEEGVREGGGAERGEGGEGGGGGGEEEGGEGAGGRGEGSGGGRRNGGGKRGGSCEGGEEGGGRKRRKGDGREEGGGGAGGEGEGGTRGGERGGGERGEGEGLIRFVVSCEDHPDLLASLKKAIDVLRLHVRALETASCSNRVTHQMLLSRDPPPETDEPQRSSRPSSLSPLPSSSHSAPAGGSSPLNSGGLGVVEGGAVVRMVGFKCGREEGKEGKEGK